MSKFQIPQYLLDAYKGVYEEEATKAWTNCERGYTLMGPDEAIDKWIREKINNHTPKEHLHTYLQWNGILGWDEQIWNLAQGSWFIK